jgi:eukaryotic-like serine/threonine-protein kinase
MGPSRGGDRVTISRMSPRSSLEPATATRRRLPSADEDSAATDEISASIDETTAATEETLVGDDFARSPAEQVLGRGDQVGRYLLLDLLGQGAMGRVFRAYDPDLDRKVAIKILHEPASHGPSARDRLLREAKAMARIHHPNVVTVHDVGIHEGSVFIAMEIVDGPSLDRWLASPRGPAAILDVLGGAARGLAAAHAAGVVHRDFKPANVLVAADGCAKVGDFGLAGIEDTTRAPTHEARPGAHAMGTPAYMSPEHFAGVGIDARSDQFSFAITLHEALHGTRPFSATTWPELVVQVTTGNPRLVLDASRGGIDGIIRRALMVDPAQRFASMDALITALERARNPAWRRWAGLGTLALALGLVVLGHADGAAACEPGAQRVAAVWGAPAKAALRVGGSDYTEAFAHRARTRFEQALDDYAAQWVTASDESCAAVGPAVQRGTPAQQRTAQCLENRLDSLQGLAELATSESLDAGRVDELVGTLPAIDDCASNRWVPYPALPAAAAQAAELHRSLAKLRRTKLADRSIDVEDVRAAVEQARELGEPYLLALALSHHASILADEGAEAGPLFDEALELALASGFDRLAAEIVNEILLTFSPHDTVPSWRELVHLVTMARALIERSGGDEVLLGNLALNEGRLLRRAGHLERAMARDQQAEQHFARAEFHEGVAKARVNQVVTLLKQGQLDLAIPRMRTAVEELERTLGSSSPVAFQGQQILAGSLSYAGRTREAFATAQDAHRRARELYTPESQTLRKATLYYAGTAMNVGEVELARKVTASLAALPNPSDREKAALDILELGFLQNDGRHEEVVRIAPTMRDRFASRSDAGDRAWLELTIAASLFVLGQRSTIHELMARPLVFQDFGEPQDTENIATAAVLLAVLSDAPPPPGTTWSSRLPTRELMTRLNRELVEVSMAIEGAADPTPTVRRIRDALAARYNDHEIYVQLLDTWLATHKPDSP